MSKKIQAFIELLTLPLNIRLNIVSTFLDKHFLNEKASLNFTDPYTLLVAVILSARCTDVKVNQVTFHLFKIAKTPKEMILLSKEEIQKIIRPCGLSPQKAHGIWESSKIIMDQYGGKVPSTEEELEALPSVGHKTAQVVLSQGFNKAAFPVDTHVFRLARRFALSNSSTLSGVEKDLKSAFKPNEWEQRHLQMIAYGRTMCKSASCDGKKSPICRKLWKAHSLSVSSITKMK